MFLESKAPLQFQLFSAIKSLYDKDLQPVGDIHEAHTYQTAVYLWRVGHFVHDRDLFWLQRRQR